MERRHLVVIGVMGAGKSTVGKLAAGRLGRRHRDSDEDIERLTGRTGAELAADPSVGVEHLHHLEAAVLLGALADAEPLVVSAAAWVVESHLCRAALERRALVVWLDATADVLWERAIRSAHRRTLDIEAFRAVSRDRRQRFEEVADARLDAEQPVDTLVDEVLALAGFGCERAGAEP